MGFKRNLSVEEIVDQLLFWRCHLSENGSPQKISRVVFMGMGEPFLNWDNLVASLKIINSPSGCFIGQRKISVSTAGIVPRIYDFTRLNTQINLAISLHSLKNHVRTSLMPVNRQFPLPVLLDACFNYVEQTKRQLFFEYVLIRDVNDSPSDLSLLIDFLRSHRLFFLNLIPANPVLSKIVPSPPQTVNRFTRTLSRLGPNFTLRRSLGADISAACGQLATK